MRSYQVDMCNGPIFKKLIIFSLPLILSGCLQWFNKCINQFIGEYVYWY